MQCPKCKNSQLLTKKAKAQDFTLEVCPRCKGIWFDRTELEEFLSSAIKGLSVPKKAFKETILCPKCGRPLYLFQYPQTIVNIDMCKKCRGLWLDAGEFKELRIVREYVAKSPDYKECDDILGVRGSLLKFIAWAIDNLSSTGD